MLDLFWHVRHLLNFALLHIFFTGHWLGSTEVHHLCDRPWGHWTLSSGWEFWTLDDDAASGFWAGERVHVGGVDSRSTGSESSAVLSHRLHRRRGKFSRLVAFHVSASRWEACMFLISPSYHAKLIPWLSRWIVSQNKFFLFVKKFNAKEMIWTCNTWSFGKFSVQCTPNTIL